MTNNEFSKLLDKKLVEVATKKDLKSLVTKEDARDFATKENLKELATKKNLALVRKDVDILKKDAKNFATKKDLERFATKKDLEGFATKKGLEAVRDDVQRVEFQLRLTEQRFEQRLEDTFSKYMKEMLGKFDRVIGELQMIREENVFRQAQFERLVERVERLEQHAGLDPLPTVL